MHEQAVKLLMEDGFVLCQANLRGGGSSGIDDTV